jgi:phenylacetate-CoA ligase
MASLKKRLMRRFQLALLAKATPDKLLEISKRRLLKAFLTAAKSEAYATVLRENAIEWRNVREADEVLRLAPLLHKHNTFVQFSLAQLAMPGTLDNLAGVLTSSGATGRFSYGLSTWAASRAAAEDIDLGLQEAFDIDRLKTLVINCLPMGVRFSSNTVCVAETSVRDDMALAIARDVGHYFDQIIIIGDPLFLKCLVDLAREQAVSWLNYRISVIIGEEPFGENYRSYLARQLGIDPNKPTGGWIGSSFGIAELGLNILFETRQTVMLRRLIHVNPSICDALFGPDSHQVSTATIFQYNPLRTFIEIHSPDNLGFGELTVSMIEHGRAIPLIRYLTGDIGCIVDRDNIRQAFDQLGLAMPRLSPLPIIALLGRKKSAFATDTATVLQFQDAIYRDDEVADAVTGAFRIVPENEQVNLHIQLRKNKTQPDASLVSDKLPPTLRMRTTIKFWAYLSFPFGLTLDYERKFVYLDPNSEKSNH